MDTSRREIRIVENQVRRYGSEAKQKENEHLPPPGEQKNIKLKEYNSSKYVELPQYTSFKCLGTTYIKMKERLNWE